MLEVSLSPAQGRALKLDIAEINQLKVLYDTKVLAHARHRDTIFEDAGQDPSSVEEYSVDEVNGVVVLRATKLKVQP